jgi:hypothetical protein
MLCQLRAGKKPSEGCKAPELLCQPEPARCRSLPNVPELPSQEHAARRAAELVLREPETVRRRLLCQLRAELLQGRRTPELVCQAAADTVRRRLLLQLPELLREPVVRRASDLMRRRLLPQLPERTARRAPGPAPQEPDAVRRRMPQVCELPRTGRRVPAFARQEPEV